MGCCGAEFYKEGHAHYADIKYYVLTIQRMGKPTNYSFSSYNMTHSNIGDILKKSLVEKTFIDLKKVNIMEYLKNGGHDVPCCLGTCGYEGDWPPCMEE